jgi:hypothetical protein
MNTGAEKAFESAARVKLLNKKGELIPEARTIFQTWFCSFSDQEGYMTPKECSDLIKATTNTIDPVRADRPDRHLAAQLAGRVQWAPEPGDLRGPTGT